MAYYCDLCGTKDAEQHDPECESMIIQALQTKLEQVESERDKLWEYVDYVARNLIFFDSQNARVYIKYIKRWQKKARDTLASLDGVGGELPKLEKFEDGYYTCVYKEHEITIQDEQVGYYIIVKAPDGLTCYDGYWTEGEGLPREDALKEAIRGACIDKPDTSKQEKRECEHDWVDATNKVVSGGEVCTKCFVIRPTGGDDD